MSDYKDTPLGWDPAKKAKRDRERDIAFARKRVGDMYQDWQSRLCKRARTRREVIQWLYDFQKALDERERMLGDLAPEVFAWEGTRKMLAQKITILTAAQICADNTAIQHVPVTMQMRTDGVVVTPKREKFRSIKEFQEIDFIKHFAEQPGFRGFYSKMAFEPKDIRYFVIAQYENDSCIACELLNDTCLDDFAQYDDLDTDKPNTNPDSNSRR